MRHSIIEGEPGIFPEPIARLFRAIGRLFGHRGSPAPPPAAPTHDPAPSDPGDHAGPAGGGPVPGGRSTGPAEGETMSPSDLASLDPDRPGPATPGGEGAGAG